MHTRLPRLPWSTTPLRLCAVLSTSALRTGTINTVGDCPQTKKQRHQRVTRVQETARNEPYADNKPSAYYKQECYWMDELPNLANARRSVSLILRAK